MKIAEWERLRGYEGRLVAIELERVSVGSVAESASLIACLASECPIQAPRLEVWRYSEKASPSTTNIHKYLVLENLTRHLNVSMFAERAGIRESPTLRKQLREHVFMVNAQPDKVRWQMKARAFERIVFKTA